MKIKDFFKNAFRDMKESAKAQREVDKANFVAVKAEAKANFEEAKASSGIDAGKAKRQAEREAQIAAANERRIAAEERIRAVKG